MNQRITNQPHQLYPIGDTKTATLGTTAKSLKELYGGEFPEGTEAVLWQASAKVEYRLDGQTPQTGQAFSSPENEKNLMGLSMANKAVLIAAADTTIVIQAFTE